MPRVYFKRYRMEFDLVRSPLPAASLPDGFRFQEWGDVWLEDHATVKARSFLQTVDSQVFRCLGEISGCRHLLRQMTGRVDFLPRATWLVLSEANEFAGPVPCGTVQGVCPSGSVGMIQNVAVLPEFRGFGVGSALVVRALRGIRESGLKRAALEVTAQNADAVRLYERLGFTRARTSYKSVNVTAPMPT